MNESEPALAVQRVYLIELCSGERRHWRYLGPGSGVSVWWQEVDGGRQFNEASLLYAWRIVAEADDSSPGASR